MSEAVEDALEVGLDPPELRIHLNGGDLHASCPSRVSP
jgi:hypothetical protein